LQKMWIDTCPRAKMISVGRALEPLSIGFQCVSFPIGICWNDGLWTFCLDDCRVPCVIGHAVLLHCSQCCPLFPSWNSGTSEERQRPRSWEQKSESLESVNNGHQLEDRGTVCIYSMLLLFIARIMNEAAVVHCSQGGSNFIIPRKEGMIFCSFPFWIVKSAWSLIKSQWFTRHSSWETGLCSCEGPLVGMKYVFLLARDSSILRTNSWGKLGHEVAGVALMNGLAADEISNEFCGALYLCMYLLQCSSCSSGSYICRLWSMPDAVHIAECSRLISSFITSMSEFATLLRINYLVGTWTTNAAPSNGSQRTLCGTVCISSEFCYFHLVGSFGHGLSCVFLQIQD
jgi:hypothetical protein